MLFPRKQAIMAHRARIVHLTTVHHPLDPRIYLKQARSLSNQGYEVWLLARGEGLTDLEDVHFVPLTGGTGRGARIKRQSQAAREIRRIKPDVVHIHDPELIPMAYRLKRSLGVKIIYDKHEDYQSREGIEGTVLSVLENWAFRWVDHLILAEEMYRSVVDGRDVPYSVVLNFALPTHSANSIERLGIRNLVYTGTVSRGRGLFHMIDLARQIKRSELDMRIRVVGICNYPEERRLAERDVAEGDLSDLISFDGWDNYASHERIREACLQADAGLMLADPEPNYVVSIPSKFYEYIQYGLPIIASDIPLWKEFLHRTECGVAVNAEDSGEVVQALSFMQKDESMDSMIQSTKRVAVDYEWARMEPILFGVYEQLLEGSS
jgi:glycosyltransferase involved in cell wall biosynthesis